MAASSQLMDDTDTINIGVDEDQLLQTDEEDSMEVVQPSQKLSKSEKRMRTLKLQAKTMKTQLIAVFNKVQDGVPLRESVHSLKVRRDQVKQMMKDFTSLHTKILMVDFPSEDEEKELDEMYSSFNEVYVPCLAAIMERLEAVPAPQIEQQEVDENSSVPATGEPAPSTTQSIQVTTVGDNRQAQLVQSGQQGDQGAAENTASAEASRGESVHQRDEDSMSVDGDGGARGPPMGSRSSVSSQHSQVLQRRESSASIAARDGQQQRGRATNPQRQRPHPQDALRSTPEWHRFNAMVNNFRISSVHAGHDSLASDSRTELQVKEEHLQHQWERFQVQYETLFTRLKGDGPVLVQMERMEQEVKTNYLTSLANIRSALEAMPTGPSHAGPPRTNERNRAGSSCDSSASQMVRRNRVSQAAPPHQGSGNRMDSSDDEEHVPARFRLGPRQQPHLPPPTMAWNSWTDIIPYCIRCEARHELVSCPTYNNIDSPIQRWRFAFRNKLCHLCLTTGHHKSNCRAAPCAYCGGMHHMLLCNPVMPQT